MGRRPLADFGPPLDPTLTFLRVLWGLGHALERRSKAMERELGVTGPQRLALRMVGLRPGITPGALAELLWLHPSTLTGILQRLVDAGFVRREPDPRDRRRAHLHLTPEGEAIDAAREGTVEAAVRAALAGASPDDVEAVVALLGAIRDATDPAEPQNGTHSEAPPAVSQLSGKQSS